MGFISTLVVLNDYLHEIGRDQDFGQKVERAVMRLSDGGPVWTGSGAAAIETHHNSGYVPVLVGHSRGVVLSTVVADTTLEQDLEVELLKRLANKHGYNLSRKPTRRGF